MITVTQTLVEEYIAWLRDNTLLRQVKGWVQITTPYLDRHNDYLQIYVKADNGGYYLTDDGYTINDLEISGCKLESDKRRQLLKLTLNGFGVQLDDNALFTRASKASFPMSKHNLIQAMLAVNDMFYLAAPLVKSLFYEDVVSWLDTNDIRYTPKLKFTGKSGYDHVFDFVIPKSKHAPERLLQSVTKPSKERVQLLAFSITDTLGTRPEPSHAYALLNDADNTVPDSVQSALKVYGIVPIPWSQRNTYVSQLAA